MDQDQAGQQLPPSDLLPQRASEGMIVYDRAGEVIGTVQVVYFGGASEEAIQRALDSETGESGLGDLPKELAIRLMKQGYIAIEGPDLPGSKRYVGPEQIDGVFPLEMEGSVKDILRLRVTRDELFNS